MLYFEKMCSKLIPKKSLYKHIDLVASKKLDSSNPYKQDLEAVGCVLRAQKKNFNRWKTIKKYVKANYTNHEDLLKEIKTLTKTKCSYHFGD